MNISKLCSDTSVMDDFNFLGEGLFTPDNQDNLNVCFRLEFIDLCKYSDTHLEWHLQTCWH